MLVHVKGGVRRRGRKSRRRRKAKPPWESAIVSGVVVKTSRVQVETNATRCGRV